jgi:hypothetical protein
MSVIAPILDIVDQLPPAVAVASRIEERTAQFLSSSAGGLCKAHHLSGFAAWRQA